MTSRTLSEIQATCAKAARGAGCAWGLAEEAGMAARALQSSGLAGAEALAAHLRGGCCGGAAGCGIVEAAGVADVLPDEPVTLEGVQAPLLILAPLIRSGRRWRVTWPGGSAEVDGGRVSLTGDLPKIATVTIEPLGEATGPMDADWRSQPVDELAWATLEALAQNTYVPETEQSRKSGAGPDR